MRPRTVVILAAVPIGAMLIACGAATSATGAAGSGATTGAVTTAAKPTGPVDTITVDGTYEVNIDVNAGTWKATVPSDSLGCYWEREKDETGSMDSILANDTVSAGGHATVTIKKSDKAFKTQGCGTWTRTT